MFKLMNKKIIAIMCCCISMYVLYQYVCVVVSTCVFCCINMYVLLYQYVCVDVSVCMCCCINMYVLLYQYVCVVVSYIFVVSICMCCCMNMCVKVGRKIPPPLFTGGINQYFLAWQIRLKWQIMANITF